MVKRATRTESVWSVRERAAVLNRPFFVLAKVYLIQTVLSASELISSDMLSPSRPARFPTQFALPSLYKPKIASPLIPRTLSSPPAYPLFRTAVTYCE